ncbi:T9SS type A sorting domain-containing protein [Cryomorphaceae bacterium]|nr:T9SS type A sorting domain-containing protein [Cryomorphaceae bacterium]
MKVMKQPLVCALLLVLYSSALAQIPTGIPLVSTPQLFGKPGCHISVAQNTWAIGYSYHSAPLVHGGPSNLAPSGTVRVFEWNGFDLVPKGGAIDSVLVGQHRNLSHILVDENTLGVSRRTPSGLQVVVYDYQGSEWVERPVPVPGATVWHMADANTVVVAEPSHPQFPATFTTVYEWDGTQWNTKGNPVNPNHSHSMFGSRVFMPSANRLAIAANGFDGRRGKVFVFYWTGNDWHPRGLPMEGDAPGDRFGSDLWMPDDNTIAIGAMGHDAGGANQGAVRVFDWNGQVWMQRGSDVVGGLLTSQAGWGFQMPDDYTLVVRSDSAVQVYQYNGWDWQPAGIPVLPNTSNQDIWSAAMSNQMLALGSASADTGTFQLYDYANLISVSEAHQPKIELYPNPAHQTLRVDVPFPQNFIIVDALGHEVYSSSESSATKHSVQIDVSQWAAGTYFLRFEKHRVSKRFQIVN